MAKIGYILKQDLTNYLDTATVLELTGGKKAIGSSPAVAGDDSVWQKLAPNAIEVVKGYSRHWYDMDIEMREFYEYSELEAFTENDRVASIEDVDENRTLYICIQDTPIGTALTNTDYFEPKDDRNTVILESSVTIVIYNLSRRKNPRQIAEQRQIDHDRTIEMLKDIQRGRVTLEIAERVLEDGIPSDDPGHTTAWGDFEDVTQDAY